MANRNSQSVPARRSDRRPTRRDELLCIAAELFADRGFAGVTVDDLGAAAGVSGPALYHHFDSKEALLGEMLIRISESLLARGKAIVAGHPPAERLAALISMHVDFAVDQRALITVHFRDLVHAREEDEQRVHDLQRSYVDIWVIALAVHRPAHGAGLRACSLRTDQLDALQRPTAAGRHGRPAAYHGRWCAAGSGWARDSRALTRRR